MKSNAILSFETQTLLLQVGTCLKVARKRRGDTIATAADRIGIARSSYERLERGDPVIGIGAFMEALHVYGFGEQLFELTDPDNDLEGRALSIRKTLK